MDCGCSAYLSPTALESDACFRADVVQVFLGALGQLLAQDLSNKGLIKGIVSCGSKKTPLTLHKGGEKGSRQGLGLASSLNFLSS